MIPVLVKIEGEIFCGKIKTDIVRSEKRKSADMLQRGGQNDLLQIFTAVKYESANVDHTLGNIDFGKTFTEAEGKVIDLGQFCVTKVHTLQSCHTLQAVCLHRGQRRAALENDLCQLRTTVKHIR